ncbi:hypothetical protein LINPERHAP2_LOCUS33577, partial [Linum perenne]
HSHLHRHLVRKRHRFIFWIANRNFPIPDGSGFLSLDSTGTLKINYFGGDIVKLYYSSSSSSSTELFVVLKTSKILPSLMVLDNNKPYGKVLISRRILGSWRRRMEKEAEGRRRKYLIFWSDLIF